MKKKTLFKILALFIALIFWTYIKLNRVQNIVLDFPVRVVNIPKSLVLTSLSKDKVKVKIIAKGINLIKFKMKKNYFYLVDAENLSYKANKIKYSNEDLNYLSNIGDFSFKILDKEKLILVFDLYAEKNVAVVLNFEDEEAKKMFVYQNCSYFPQEIVISGAKQNIKNFSKLNTSLIKESDIVNGKLIPLEISDSIFSKNKEITLEIVKTKLVEKTISLIPITYPIDMGFAIIPQKVSLKIKGSASILNNLSLQDIKAYLNKEDMKENNLPLIKIEMSKELELIEITPERVQIIKNEKK